MQMNTIVYVLTAMIALSSTLEAVLGDSETHKMNKMAETLKMLQSLDKFYGQAARPRFPRSSPYGIHLLSRKDEASLKLRLRDLDSQYLHRSRPRFGKRGDYPRLQERLEEAMNEEVPDEQMWDPLR